MEEKLNNNVNKDENGNIVSADITIPAKKEEENNNVSVEEYSDNIGFPEEKIEEQPSIPMENVKEVDNDSEKLSELNEKVKENIGDADLLDAIEENEEYKKLEEEYKIEWDKIEFDSKFSELPIVTEQDINVLVASGIVEENKQELTNIVDNLRTLIKQYSSFKLTNENDKKGLYQAKCYLARLQRLSREEGNVLTSAEVNYVKIRAVAYVRLAMFIAKKRDISMEKAFEEVKSKGYWLSFLEAIVNDKETVKNAIKSCSNLVYRQVNYQKIVEKIMKGNKLTMGPNVNAFDLSIKNLSHLIKSFDNFIDFAKIFSLTQDTVRANNALAQIGPEMFEEFRQAVEAGDNDGYFRGRSGIFLPFFEETNATMLKLDDLFIQNKENEKLKQYTNDMVAYCANKITKEMKKGENIDTEFKRLNEKYISKPLEFTFKEFKKLNNLEVYSHYFDIYNDFRKEPTDKNAEYVSHSIFRTAFSNIFVTGLKELFEFIENSGLKSDDQFITEEVVTKWNKADIEANLGRYLGSTLSSLVQQSIILDMGISIIMLNAPINMDLKEVLDKTLNKKYIDNSANVKAFLRIDRENSRIAISNLALNYAKNVLEIWASYLAEDIDYDHWDLKVKLPNTIKNKK